MAYAVRLDWKNPGSSTEAIEGLKIYRFEDTGSLYQAGYVDDLSAVKAFTDSAELIHTETPFDENYTSYTDRFEKNWGTYKFGVFSYNSLGVGAGSIVSYLERPPTTHTVELSHPTDLNSTVDLEMIWVEPGTFTMGSPTTEAGGSSYETQHEVTLTQGFYLGKYEVTQAQYEAVMTGNTDSLSATPSSFAGNPNRPVEQVSWEGIQVFLTRLNEQQSANLPNGWSYVLPTEAQWEYACRAGTTTAYSWGDSITTDNANYSDSGYSQTRDVGQYSANPWGFFDMHGNVREWTADWYAAYSSGAQTDPEGPATGSARVTRGGSWSNTGTDLRSAYRHGFPPSNRYYYIGFRVGLIDQS